MENDTSKKNILVSAYSCNPNMGSEPGVGWNWALELAKYENIFVLTRKKNQSAIQEFLAVNPTKNIKFIYYDLPKRLNFCKKTDRGIYLHYLLWQIGAFRVSKKLIKKIKFDYCFHITFGNMWLPTFLPLLKIPFIWGPVGGGESIPLKFCKNYSVKEKILLVIKKIFIRFSFLNPFFVISCKKSKVILVRTKDSLNAIPDKYRSKSSIILETAIEEQNIKKIKKDREINNIVKFVFVGKLNGVKSAETIICASSLLGKKYDFEVNIIGDGPMLKKLRKLTNRLNLVDKVKFWGNLPRREIFNHLKKSDVFIYPSFSEAGSWSLMEAMAFGLPIICTDANGMHMITDDDCAIRIPLTTVKNRARDFARAMEELMNNPERRKQMGNCSKEAIKRFSWKKKIKFIRKQI